MMYIMHASSSKHHFISRISRVSLVMIFVVFLVIVAPRHIVCFLDTLIFATSYSTTFSEIIP